MKRWRRKAGPKEETKLIGDLYFDNNNNICIDFYIFFLLIYLWINPQENIRTYIGEYAFYVVFICLCTFLVLTVANRYKKWSLME